MVDQVYSRQSTRSVTQSQIEEVVENGRRYCSRSYFMPADDAEQTRLAVVHQAFLPILEGQLTLAAIPRNVERILDVGTGTGDWAIAIAERFPEAEIMATDLTSAFQPSNAPENVFFELDDAQDEWTYTDPFDFVHIRGLIGAFTDWSKVYHGAAKHLKRGASLEVADMGLISLTPQPEDSQLAVFNENLQLAARKAGTPINFDHLSRASFEESGLNLVKTKTFNVPLGSALSDRRKKVAAKMGLISALEGLEAMSLRLFTRHLEWIEEDVKNLCERVKAEVLEEGARPSMQICFVVARKIL